jgi:hypothetical protein
MNKFFFKKNEFLKKIWKNNIYIYIYIIYYNIVIQVVKLFRVYVAYDNYDDFQHVNFIFSQNFISLFLGLFNDKTDLRVRHAFVQTWIFLKWSRSIIMADPTAWLLALTWFPTHTWSSSKGWKVRLVSQFGMVQPTL